MKRVRILLADDHLILLEGLKQMLGQEFELLGVATNGRELLHHGRTLKPDVIISDIAMPELTGLEAVAELRKEGISPKVIFLTMLGETEIALQAFRSGADGFVLKHCAGTELVIAINEVMAGRTYLTPRIARNVLTAIESAASSSGEKHSSDIASAPHAALAHLTNRQIEVLRLVSQGKTMKEVGAVLSISTRTAEAHKYQMMANLEVRTVAELIQYGIRAGLVGTAASHTGPKPAW
jgi:DNA-binding NarL/FixJ family response regulator